MGLMTRFKNKKKKDPDFGHDATEAKIVATMPKGIAAKGQAISKFMAEMAKDLATLKVIKSIAQKIEVKRNDLVPKYLPIASTLKKSHPEHAILGQILVWLFDIKDIPAAMELARHCIEHNVPMPERFKSDLPSFLCRMILEWAEIEHEEERSVEPYFSEIFELQKDWDIHDDLRSGFYRLKGYVSYSKANYSDAIENFKKAAEYGAKVKTILNKAKSKLENQEPETETDQE